MAARFALKKLGQTFAQNGTPVHYTKTSIRQLATIQRLGLDNPNMSQTVIHNGIVYISGQVDATAGDIKGQTEDVLGKVDDLLQEAGTDKSKLLTASIWVKDIENDFAGMNSVWNQWLDPNNKPVRATGTTKFCSYCTVLFF
jgi:enamine deaminase RidA (YjgF/YER057c/UK114 family)